MSTGPHLDMLEIVATAREQEGAYPVIREPKRWMGAKGEQPDVIAFHANGISSVDEIKLSRSDFMADAKKPHVMGQTPAMGRYRTYVCPEGLIEAHEVEERGYGLAWIVAGELVEVTPAPERHRPASWMERDVLLKWARAQREPAKAVAGRIGPRTKKPGGGAWQKAIDEIVKEPGIYTTSRLMRTLGIRGQSAGKVADELEATGLVAQDGAGGVWLPVNDDARKGA